MRTTYPRISAIFADGSRALCRCTLLFCSLSQFYLFIYWFLLRLYDTQNSTPLLRGHIWHKGITVSIPPGEAELPVCVRYDAYLHSEPPRPDRWMYVYMYVYWSPLCDSVHGKEQHQLGLGERSLKGVLFSQLHE